MIAVFLTILAVAASAATVPYPEARTSSRFELFGIVQMLAGAETRYSGFHRHDIPYTRAAETWFKPYARHPVVEVYERLAAKGLDTVFFHDFIFNLDEPPGLEPREPFEPEAFSEAGGPAAMEEFRVLLSDFARTSRFEAFSVETAPLLKAMTEEVSEQARTLDAKSRLERYTGMPVRQNYTIIVSPFAEPVLGSTWARDDNETRRITSLYGPESTSAGFGFRMHTRLGGIWSEILIDQLGPAARPYRARLNRSKALYAPLSGVCAVDWYECVQRQISFAVAARLLDHSGEHEAAQEWPVKYARIGLPHIGAFVERLRDFESDRVRYPTLIDFYPRLIEEVEALARGPVAPIPFQGGIRAVLQDPAGHVVILPGAEAPGVAQALRSRAQDRWKGATLMTDAQAMTTDLKGRALIVIGTLSGNRWLGKRFHELQLPLRLEGAALSFDARPGETNQQAFSGNVGLISTALNPVDPSRGMLLYTAANSELLATALGAYDGPADFVVLEGTASVKQGRYEKTRRPWRLK